MGEDAALIRAILRWGGQVSPHVADLREGQPPMTDHALQPALVLLKHPADERHPAAMLAIGCSGRTDYRPLIQAALLASPPQSKAALYAILALAHLGGCGEEVLPRVIEQYRAGHHKFAVLQLLGARLAAEADDLVPRLLPEAPGTPGCAARNHAIGWGLPASWPDGKLRGQLETNCFQLADGPRGHLYARPQQSVQARRGAG